MVKPERIPPATSARAARSASGAGRFSLRAQERLAKGGGWVELLRLPAAGFGLAARLRGTLYDRGWLASERVDAGVVSVGNLSAGGTGKTPCVAWVARALVQAGSRVGVASRGYGAAAGLANDEQRLLAEQLGGVEFASARERVRAARELLARGCDAIVLDDGFQHRRLARDLDLVLVDATQPFGLPWDGRASPPRALFPRGLLREPPSALARAQAVVITRSDQLAAGALELLSREVERLAPRALQARACHRPVRLASLRVGSRAPDLAWLEGRTLNLLSAIAHPLAFQASAQSLGARVASHRRFPDHHAFRESDLEGLGDQPLLCTEKDAVKLRAFAELLPRESYALAVEFQLTRGEREVRSLLERLPRSRASVERDALHAGLAG